MDSVIKYPQKVIGEMTKNNEIVDPTPEDFYNPSDDESEEGEENNGEENGDSNSNEIVELWVDGILQGDVTVVVSGINSSTEAVNIMIQNGLLDSYSEYKSICDSIGRNHESVHVGTFSFKKGCTKEDVVKAFCW